MKKYLKIKFKWLLLLFIVLGNTGFAQDWAKPLDRELSEAIAKKVLRNAPYDSTLPAIVFPQISPLELREYTADTTNSFMTTIRAVFGASDMELIYRLSHSLNMGPKDHWTNLVVAPDTFPTKYAKILEMRRNSSHSVIDRLFILYDKSKEKCLVFMHYLWEGMMYEILERKNGVWTVTAFRTLWIE